MNINVELENLRFINNIKYYTCTISEQVIPENTELNLIRVHDFEYWPNSHVSAVIIRDCEVSKVPQGLMKIFPNLKILHIVRSKLKVVTKNDLAEYKNIEMIEFCNNEIEYLPRDLFEGFMNLEEVSFNGNKLQLIELNILDELDNLLHVNFKDNPSYTKCFSELPLSNSNATLDEVKDELFVRLYKYQNNIEDLLKVKDENNKLKKTIDSLNSEIIDLKDNVDDLNHENQNFWQNYFINLNRLESNIFYTFSKTTSNLKILLI